MKHKGDPMGVRKTVSIAALIVAVGLPLVLAEPAAAAPAGVTNVENFIRSVITVFAGLAGLVATGFFVAGGFTYITSSGNPEQLGMASASASGSRRTSLSSAKVLRAALHALASLSSNSLL